MLNQLVSREVVRMDTLQHSWQQHSSTWEISGNDLKACFACKEHFKLFEDLPERELRSSVACAVSTVLKHRDDDVKHLLHDPDVEWEKRNKERRLKERCAKAVRNMANKKRMREDSDDDCEICEDGGESFHEEPGFASSEKRREGHVVRVTKKKKVG